MPPWRAPTGGAIYDNASGRLELYDCLLSGNIAGGSAGGLYDYYGTTEIHDSQIVNNTASNGSGGGIYHYDVSMSLYRASDDELENAIHQTPEPMLPVLDRLGDFREVVTAFHPEGACAEASRCLRCDLEKTRS